jgi:hypothetical protein
MPLVCRNELKMALRSLIRDSKSEKFAEDFVEEGWIPNR